MKKYFLFLPMVMLWIGVCSCQTNRQQDTSESLKQPAGVAFTDTLPTYTPAIQTHLDQLREEWSTVPNPLVATFRSSEFGDYFHLIFEDAAGRMYDFGDGNNELTNITLYDDDFMSNPAFVGKTFKISWAWKNASFYCCEGEMNSIEASVPSIVQLEQLPDK